MNALRKQAEKETGISVPSYYNPLVVNPMMFAQQQAKRNLLWSKKDKVMKRASASCTLVCGSFFGLNIRQCTHDVQCCIFGSFVRVVHGYVDENYQ